MEKSTNEELQPKPISIADTPDTPTLFLIPDI